MPLIRTCDHCGKKNSIPAKYLASTGRCGACKSPLPPLAEPLEADAALFDEVVQNVHVPYWWISGRRGAVRAARLLPRFREPPPIWPEKRWC